MLDLHLTAPCGKLRQISAAAEALVTHHTHVLQVCTDPDFPGPDDKDRKEFVHWLVINIPGGAGLYRHKTPPATNPFAPHAPSLQPRQQQQLCSCLLERSSILSRPCAKRGRQLLDMVLCLVVAYRLQTTQIMNNLGMWGSPSPPSHLELVAMGLLVHELYSVCTQPEGNCVPVRSTGTCPRKNVGHTQSRLGTSITSQGSTPGLCWASSSCQLVPSSSRFCCRSHLLHSQLRSSWTADNGLEQLSENREQTTPASVSGTRSFWTCG